LGGIYPSVNLVVSAKTTGSDGLNGSRGHTVGRGLPTFRIPFPA
jgi:hypothetical protein